MDQYGSFKCTPADAEQLADQLKEHGTVVFAWSHNDFDGFIFMASINFKTLGTMPFGGSPRGRAYIGLWGRGCDHVRMDGGLLKYDLDKLNIDEEAAEKFADFWNAVCRRINGSGSPRAA